MGADQCCGLVVAKASTGPRPAKIRRTAIAKPRPIPRKELYYRLVRTKHPTRKSLKAPAERENLHPHGFEKRSACLSERKKQQQDTYVAPKWDGLYNPNRPNLYQDYKGSDEQRKEKLEWWARLYAHRAAHRQEGRQMDRRSQGGAATGDCKGR